MRVPIQLLKGKRAIGLAARILVASVLLVFIAGHPTSGAPHSYAPPSTLSLAGQWKWQAAETAGARAFDPGLSDKEWPSMQVPSNWFLQGHDLNGDVWLRTNFEAAADSKGRLITLHFDGVDYSCDVWLNGTYLGSHEGYFEPFHFDVSGLIRESGENVLAVRVSSPDEEPGIARSLHKRLIKGIFNRQDTRPGGRWSARGQDHNTGGIWAPVYLRISDGAAIQGLRVSVQPSEGGDEGEEGRDWIADIDLGIESAESRGLSVEAWLRPVNFTSGRMSGGDAAETRVLKSGSDSVSLRIVSTNTQLWWSWDQGRQRLYRLTVRLKRGQQEVDRKEVEIGFRTVRMDPHTNQWWLNGRRIALKETDYIPTQLLSEMTDEHYSADLTQMKNANVNAIRVHAHVEPSAFYRESDRAGFLVWQDFPLQWGYAEDEIFESEAVRQAKAMVGLLSRHPSIVAWNMHSEPPWNASWMKDRYANYSPLQNKRLDEKLYHAVKAADPTRYVHLASEGTSIPGASAKKP